MSGLLCLQCYDNQAKLTDCFVDYTPNWGVVDKRCSHARDVSVQCEAPKRERRRGGGAVFACCCALRLLPACRYRGARPAAHPLWAPRLSACRAVGVRLVDWAGNATPGLKMGRLEVSINGTWGTVCSTAISLVRHDELAATVCRQLGLGQPARLIANAVFGRGSGPVWSDNIRCEPAAGLPACVHVCMRASRVAQGGLAGAGVHCTPRGRHAPTLAAPPSCAAPARRHRAEPHRGGLQVQRLEHIHHMVRREGLGCVFVFS